jgi:hypothetical protein
MRRFMHEHLLSPGDYVQRSARCAETSDGEHTGGWHEGGPCGACGLLGPQPDDEAEAVRKCNACPAPATCSEFRRCPLDNPGTEGGSGDD